MKNKIILLLLAMSFSVFSHVSNAGALKKDCTPVKAGKSAAMKATVGVDGRCSPADAAKDSAEGAAGIGANDNGMRKVKDTDKNKDKDKDKDKGKNNNKLLKKVIK